MQRNLVENLRDGRKSPAVLLQKLVLLRARRPCVPVFVFEGSDDLPAYEVWIKGIEPSKAWEPLPGQGKDQVLGFRAILKRTDHSLSAGVWFVVDHDYDGLKGHAPGSDIYVTDLYSIENALCTREAVASLLRDEFRCAGNVDVCDAVEGLFDAAVESFVSLVKDESLRLFVARRRGIPVVRIVDSLFPLIAVGLAETRWKTEIRTLVHTLREIESAELDAHVDEFSRLRLDHWTRGKFMMYFFKQWLTCLAAERESTESKIFPAHLPPAAFSSEHRTVRALASRVRPPVDFACFARSALLGDATFLGEVSPGTD